MKKRSIHEVCEPPGRQALLRRTGILSRFATPPWAPYFVIGSNYHIEEKYSMRTPWRLAFLAKIDWGLLFEAIPECAHQPAGRRIVKQFTVRADHCRVVVPAVTKFV
jgi:hypothetical protein